MGIHLSRTICLSRINQNQLSKSWNALHFEINFITHARKLSFLVFGADFYLLCAIEAPQQTEPRLSKRRSKQFHRRKVTISEKKRLRSTPRVEGDNDTSRYRVKFNIITFYDDERDT